MVALFYFSNLHESFVGKGLRGSMEHFISEYRQLLYLFMSDVNYIG